MKNLDGQEQQEKQQRDSLPAREERQRSGRNLMKDATRYLKSSELKVIYYRYLSQNPKTQKEIGEVLDLCTSRIQQIEKKALRKMRSYIPTLLD